ncbi:MAG: CHC2 zinc finger domain-containing protein [Candidatus Shapirobacteria bacterium]|nr:CHC2 zinc finger domain-containing protein [Candidatus Shapirobacteria bacterium]
MKINNMGLIDKETIEKIKRENNIIQIAEKLGIVNNTKKISNGVIQINCIFHEEKTPSLTLYPETRSFYCYGCGKSGDVVELVRKKISLTFQQALKWLDPTLEISPQINFDEAKKYLIDHGINSESQQKFDFCFTKYRIGPTPYPSIKFKTPKGYKHRIFGLEGTKYRFKKGGKCSLFKTGGNPKIAVITEGEFDSIRVWQETGYSCFSPTTGNMGFSEKYTSEFIDFDLIVVAFDNDIEGKNGAKKTIQTLKKKINPDKIIQIEVPETLGKDWCDFFGKGKTKEDFDELIQKSRPP